MDLKKETARWAFNRIKHNSSVGLGDGATVRWLADYIIEGIKNGLTVKLYTSSQQTQNFLNDAGIFVSDYTKVEELDQYFDGCDQIDHQLNVFKSGAGIHTIEKLLACLAKNIIIMADASKFISKLDNQFPLVLEILPQATLFVLRLLRSVFPDTTLTVRTSDEMKTPVLTRNGNYLIDCRFKELPELEFLQNQCKSITGVVEISLFYKIVSEAIIVDGQGMRRFERKNDIVRLADQSGF